MTINVRFAPSPTGFLHIGNIRAALYNYLFARRNGGSFMLRMDDTDQKRSTLAFEEALYRDLQWLGLKWDKFARQYERIPRYLEVLEQLKASGRAYPCFETQAELDLKRKTQLGRSLPPVYDRSALKLTEADRAKLIAEGHKPYWRFKLNDTDVIWDDLVQGHKVFSASSVSDPVLMRDDGVPLYTFCSVVDDIDFNITHVIRGEDHVTNTTTQIQIWEAITTTPPPIFAHYPLLVTATGEEMSKRIGGNTSIVNIRDELKIEAMAINALLAKLGTSDPIMPRLTLEELAAEFALDKISRATPKLDFEELQHLNAKILHQTPFEMVRERLNAIEMGMVDETFWNALRTNLTKLEDIKQWWHIAHNDIQTTITDAAFIKQAADLLPSAPWDENTWHVWTEAVKKESGRKGKELYMPLRLALTGESHGPEMKTLLPIIGVERARTRLTV